MNAKSPAPSREERLAAKLRENLRRRKAQARAIGADATGDAKAGAQACNGDDTRALSKEPQKS